MTRDEVVLLVFAIISMAFVAWEMAGVMRGTPIHTISYWAYRLPLLRYLILFGFTLGPVWWMNHMQTAPPK